MIISTIEGNLISLAQGGRYTEIAHGCNCFHTMGAGIAPQIARAFPDAEKADNESSYGDKLKLGRMSIGTAELEGFEHTLKILNLYTQFGTKGRIHGLPDIDYTAVARAFKLANAWTKEKKEKKLYSVQPLMGIPMIGAGLAGGHWEALSTIINLVTPDMDIELVVYKP